MSNLCVDKVAECCIDLFQKLPKSGKPLENQWTVLSCVVQYDKLTEVSNVVALGTGSKCIGATQMSAAGNTLNDSHAEVFARRGFLIYLYENIKNAIEDKPSIFVKVKDKFTLKDNIEFIFYSSQMPCGDASIIPKTGEEIYIGDIILSDENKAQVDSYEVECKRQKLDIHRTGAKCLPHSEQDPLEPGERYHLLGQVRTKPGRGHKTLSVSCSDKMARWIHIGIQGALLDLLLVEPIFIKHFIFGAGIPYNEKALQRALLMRNSEHDFKNRLSTIPTFHQCSKIFPYVKAGTNVKPASESIVWVKTQKSFVEVAVNGRKLGVTKQKANSLKNCLSISKYSLYKKFQEILYMQNDILMRICGEEKLNTMEYNKMKKKAFRYQTNWCETKNNFFKIWTVKPDMWNFCLSDN